MPCQYRNPYQTSYYYAPNSVFKTHTVSLPFLNFLTAEHDKPGVRTFRSNGELFLFQMRLYIEEFNLTLSNQEVIAFRCMLIYHNGSTESVARECFPPASQLLHRGQNAIQKKCFCPKSAVYGSRRMRFRLKQSQSRTRSTLIFLHPSLVAHPTP